MVLKSSRGILSAGGFVDLFKTTSNLYIAPLEIRPLLNYSKAPCAPARGILAKASERYK
jgi:hypothetical protein